MALRHEVLAAITSLLLLLLSIAALAVAGITSHRHYYYEYVDPDYIGTPAPKGQVSPQPYIPSDGTTPGLLHGQVAIGALGLFGSLIALLQRARIWHLRGAASESGKFVVPMLLLFAVAIIGVFGWVFDTYMRSASLFVDPSVAAGPLQVIWDSSRTDGLTTVSWETWTCGLEPYMDSLGQYGNWWGTSCRLNIAAKWLTVPVLVFAILTPGAVWFAAAEAKKKNGTTAGRVAKHGNVTELDEYGNSVM